MSEVERRESRGFFRRVRVLAEAGRMLETSNNQPIRLRCASLRTDYPTSNFERFPFSLRSKRDVRCSMFLNVWERVSLLIVFVLAIGVGHVSQASSLIGRAGILPARRVPGHRQAGSP